MIRKLLYAIVFVLVGFSVIGLTLFFVYARSVPRLPDDLRLLASSPPTEIYARDGDLLTSLGGREYVAIDRISPYFLQAIIAAEDKRFYEHNGIDFYALTRSIWLNIIRGGGAPGGSTITQQLAKNMFFSFKRSYERKILEALATFAIEDRFSKDEILEAYCNLVYFGRFAYGIENAATIYFSRHAAELEQHEAALLAGLPNSPSRLNPFNNFEAAQKRQSLIISRMAGSGIISAAQADSLRDVPIILKAGRIPIEKGSYPIDYAIDIASTKIGRETVRYGGVRLLTSVDPLLQDYAEQAVFSGLNELESRMKKTEGDSSAGLQAALVAIDVVSGQIVAMVGGKEYQKSTYNRAIHGMRHPGSALKPVTYLTGLEKSLILPTTILVDEPVELMIDKKRAWKPINFSKKFRGPLTVKYGLMRSINTIAAQVMGMVGPESVVETAHRLGIKKKLKPYLTLALGAQGISPVDMAVMYATLARQGIHRDAFIVNRIEGRSRDLLFENLSASETRFAAETVYILTDMLRGVLDGGTGSIIRRRGFRGIGFGKTGTSSDYHDSWFCGATPGLVAVVWVGYDDNRSMYLSHNAGVTGASGAAPIWADFMMRATAGEPVRNFSRPPGITTLFMDPVTAELGEFPQENGWISVSIVKEAADSLLTIQLDAALEDSLLIIEADSTFHPATDSLSMEN